MSTPDFEVGSGDDRIAGWRSGAGPAVLLLHGGPGLSEYMDSLEPELVDGYTVVRYQQRGLDPSTLAGPFDVASQAKDAIAVLDHLGYDRVTVVGHSWGGHLALHLLTLYPERLAAALIIDPLGAVADGGEADLGRILGERLTPEAAQRAAEIDEKAMRGEGTDLDQMEALNLVWPAYFADPVKAPPMPPLRISIPAYSATFDSIHDHFKRKSLVSGLPSCQVPTTLLLGAESPIPNKFGIETAALIPGAELRVVADSGHFPWLERPGVTRSELDALRARASL
ncbi:MAG TPA: alpha/beta hydrolase [Candidatus Dormibacteraeota bacterium]